MRLTNFVKEASKAPKRKQKVESVQVSNYPTADLIKINAGRRSKPTLDFNGSELDNMVVASNSGQWHVEGRLVTYLSKLRNTETSIDFPQEVVDFLKRYW